MMTLIDDLLEMSRLDYGKIDIKEDKCDLEEVIVTAYDCIWRSEHQIIMTHGRCSS